MDVDHGEGQGQLQVEQERCANAVDDSHSSIEVQQDRIAADSTRIRAFDEQQFNEMVGSVARECELDLSDASATSVPNWGSDASPTAGEGEQVQQTGQEVCQMYGNTAGVSASLSNCQGGGLLQSSDAGSGEEDCGCAKKPQRTQRFRQSRPSKVLSPGPANIDNRFHQTGTRSRATLRSAPSYSFGKSSAEIFPSMKTLPGPTTAGVDFGSTGGPLERLSKPRSPSWNFGAQSETRFPQKQFSVPCVGDPGAVVITKRMLEARAPPPTRALSDVRMQQATGRGHCFATSNECCACRRNLAVLHRLVSPLHPERYPHLHRNSRPSRQTV
eukprot:5083599-Pleurochrysis_carterae.AAC.2